MLQDCSLNKGVVDKLKIGSMPSADKLVKIAQYLDVSVEYLMGFTDDPTPPKKVLTLDEQVAAEYYKLSVEEREDVREYFEFLKIKRERRARLANEQKESVSGLLVNV
jgi:transcriptional regulator with XRE-family HTH domain